MRYLAACLTLISALGLRPAAAAERAVPVVRVPEFFVAKTANQIDAVLSSHVGSYLMLEAPRGGLTAQPSTLIIHEAMTMDEALNAEGGPAGPITPKSLHAWYSKKDGSGDVLGALSIVKKHSGLFDGSRGEVTVPVNGSKTEVWHFDRVTKRLQKGPADSFAKNKGRSTQ